MLEGIVICKIGLRVCKTLRIYEWFGTARLAHILFSLLSGTRVCKGIQKFSIYLILLSWLFFFFFFLTAASRRKEEYNSGEACTEEDQSRDELYGWISLYHTIAPDHNAFSDLNSCQLPLQVALVTLVISSMATRIYTPLNLARHEIRLLELKPATRQAARIECRLYIVSLEETPQYEVRSGLYFFAAKPSWRTFSCIGSVVRMGRFQY
jgi:hypothetical protein